MKTFHIEGKELPTLLLGSSPFCGADQFKEKAPVYFQKFFLQPANITDLLVQVCQVGYRGAHLVPFPPIAGAALQAYKTLGYRFPVILTLMPGSEEAQWEWIRKLDTAAVFLHASETDRLDLDSLQAFSRRCRQEGVTPGFSTHNGGAVIPAIDKAGIDCAAYLCPFNKTGAHVHPSLKETLAAITATPRVVVGMKILSCGLLGPGEAFPFSLPYVNAVTVGMVSREEVEENCRVFESYHHLLPSRPSMPR
jgi:hypothetical protein